jgi:hypothetical protein
MKLTRGKIYKYLSLKNQTTKNKNLYVLSTFSFPTFNITQKKAIYSLHNKTLRNF